MFDITEFEEALQTLKDKQSVLLHETRGVEREIRRMKSKNFIAANAVSKIDVELSNGDDRPWFGDVFVFTDWLKGRKPLKRFVEWRGRLCFTSELIEGKFKPTDGYVEDLT